MEMVKPFRTANNAYDPSPISPSNVDPYGPSPVSTTDMKSAWPSPEVARHSNNPWGKPTTAHKQQPSIQSSVITFDESVIEDDKAKAEREMERLYAAVMEHDEQKSRSFSDVRPGQSAQNPPELRPPRGSGASSPPPRTATTSPSRIPTTSPRAKYPKPSPISTTGTTTHSRASSRTSFGSFNKKRGVRSLTISPPMGSPDLIPTMNKIYGETEPLSPRYYNNPGPPPPTPPQKPNSQRREPRSPLEQKCDNTRLSPQRSSFRNPFVPTIQTTPSDLDTFDEEPPHHAFKPTKRSPPPLPLSVQTQAALGPTPNQHLPLRSAPLPFRALRANTYSDRPPSTIKATILERKAPTANEGGLRPPLTGVPATPYSPYMPFTPLTPLTPSRLVGRQERKRREREEGRRVVTREDQVVEEGELWGDGYR